MSDGYDLFCMMKIGEYNSSSTSYNVEDEVACACVKYLALEGYLTSSDIKAGKQAIMPTTL